MQPRYPHFREHPQVILVRALAYPGIMLRRCSASTSARFAHYSTTPMNWLATVPAVAVGPLATWLHWYALGLVISR